MPAGTETATARDDGTIDDLLSRARRPKRGANVIKGNDKGTKNVDRKARILELRKRLRVPKRPAKGELPDVIQKNHVCYKVTYVFLHALMLWMLSSLPACWLYTHPKGPEIAGPVDGEAMSLCLLAVCAALAALFMVQGTDAGYIRSEVEGSRENEAKGLLAADGGDADRLDDIRKPIPVSSDVIEPHMRSEPAPEGDADAKAAPVSRASAVLASMGGAGDGSGGGGEAERGPAPDSGALLSAPPKYCDDCKMWMPVRAKHCHACGLCVSTFDHHCHTIGTCIGERNHCRFWWYLMFETLAVCVGLSLVHSGFVYRLYWTDWMSANGLALVGAIILWLLLLMVGGLFVFHSWLAMTNMTGYELTKGADNLWYLPPGTRDCDLPFSAGWVRNLQGFCCSRDGMWEVLGKRWKRTDWKPPGRFARDSDNVWDNMWENKYWSCC